jgi:mRNA-degrading endonuclease toxin of MazEF toxin-antitoxin module
MNRGDVVQVVWPYSDGSGSKSRPAVVCVNVLTIDQVRIGRLIGYLSPATMQQVENCLKKVLVLP